MSSAEENQVLESEAIKALRRYEKCCKKRHREIQRQFRNTNKGVRNWTVGSGIFLTLIVTVMSVSSIIAMNYLGRPIVPTSAEQKVIAVDMLGNIFSSIEQFLDWSPIKLLKIQDEHASREFEIFL